ncbi:hypothetical protein EXIGLDRAFT_731202 [Exidia glandulosa HHB12029]|uniref:Uncharacterized protein n=1 Tax=Exidia glandulosa HHB12029 TaxID=1314781 RepID=A0A165BYT9_EXIGL|nr:hypothetical protein EXIGLDRAFT_731202 [Exidia glandulosa HHB12029]
MNLYPTALRWPTSACGLLLDLRCWLWFFRWRFAQRCAFTTSSFGLLGSCTRFLHLQAVKGNCVASAACFLLHFPDVSAVTQLVRKFNPLSSS